VPDPTTPVVKVPKWGLALVGRPEVGSLGEAAKEREHSEASELALQCPAVTLSCEEVCPTSSDIAMC